MRFIERFYYQIKPAIPRQVQIYVRRLVVRRKRLFYKHVWPIDENAGNPPNGWPGWPNNKRFALILTHDVETARGQEKCKRLSMLEEELGFCSSFNFVPLRYQVHNKLRHYLSNRGFEIGVHGLYHDGKLYYSKEEFKRRAIKINHYLKEWGCVGFRSPAMHHNLDWIHDLNILYDSSTFDTDPFEPQPNGVGTIFPFWVRGNNGQRDYIELPCTMPQDFTLFVLMGEKRIDIWKRKLDWIAEHGGMALLNTHPDYMSDKSTIGEAEEYPVDYYVEFLEYIESKYEGHYWHVRPKDMANYCLTVLKKMV